MEWSLFFFFNDTATTEIYTLSLHDALPICGARGLAYVTIAEDGTLGGPVAKNISDAEREGLVQAVDRKSTRLNSSHANISYAVFCLKKKKNHNTLYFAIQHMLYTLNNTN